MVNYGSDLHSRQCDMSKYGGSNGRDEGAIVVDELTHENPDHSYKRAYAGEFPEAVVDKARRDMEIDFRLRNLRNRADMDLKGPAHPGYRQTVLGSGAFPYDNPDDLLESKSAEVPVATATPPEPVWEGRLAETAREARKQRVYLSGPMRGVPDLNHPAFDALQAAMENEGWTVHSPAQSNRDHGHTPQTPYSECIRVDVESLLDSDAICLLPGWRQSEGARFEVQVAQNLGLMFYEARTMRSADCLTWAWVPTNVADQGVEGPDQEARRLVYGDRAATYGHPRGDFECIGGIWAAMVQAKLNFWAFQNGVDLPQIPWFELINDELVATMMTGLKCARQVKSPQHRDTMVDIIGYQLCQARLHEEPSEVAAWEGRQQ